MASWKKVLVSGSSIEVAAITASVVPTGTTENVLLVDGTGKFKQITQGALSSALGSYNFTGSADTGTAAAIDSGNMFRIVGGNGIDTSFAKSTTTGSATVTLDTGSTHFNSGVSKEVFDAANFVDSSEVNFAVTAGASVTAALINGSIANARLANSAITVTAGAGLTGGGSTSLGSSTTVNVGAGLGITVNVDDVALKNAGSLTDATLPLWDDANGQLANSIVSEGGGVITVNGGLEVGAPTGVANAGQIVTQAGIFVESQGVNVTGDSTFINNVTVQGNLTVNGTTTTISTDNLLVEDKFVLFASGSATATDGGIIIQASAGAGTATGFAYGYDAGIDRWIYQDALAFNATTFGTPTAYAVTAEYAASTPPASPAYGGASGYGNIYVNTSTQEIFIYS